VYPRANRHRVIWEEMRVNIPVCQL
jgi:hypothetical protein